jgi:3-oxoacyl-[acyl-carrier-protein] synthase II
LIIGSRRFGIKLATATAAATTTTTISAPRREKDPKKRVVITGLGCVSVFGNDVNVFYNKLLQGMSGISLIDKFDASSFPTKFAGQIRGFSAEGYIDAKNMRRMDDSLKYCLVSGKKALEHAGLGGELLNSVRVFFENFPQSHVVFESFFGCRTTKLTHWVNG